MRAIVLRRRGRGLLVGVALVAHAGLLAGQPVSPDAAGSAEPPAAPAPSTTPPTATAPAPVEPIGSDEPSGALGNQAQPESESPDGDQTANVDAMKEGHSERASDAEASAGLGAEQSEMELTASSESDGSDTDTAALLAQLEADTGGVPLEATPSLQLYGFADFSFYKMFTAPRSTLGAIVATKPSFAVGNLNLYLSGDLGEGWESLSEVRFTYLPNGSRKVNTTTGEVERTETVVADYTNFWRARNVGGIFIERAWLQYTADPLFTIRGGSWLTPYGIWNVDHGSPTIISVLRPYVIGLELLPEAQTGVQLRGTGYPTESISLGYALGLSNGRGPVQAYTDLDTNKAVTVRLHGSHRGDGTLAFGVSGYYGRFTDLQQSTRVAANGAELRQEIVEQYDELSLGADVKYTRDGFHVQAEFIVNERAYTEEGRTLHSATTFVPDIRRYGGYGVLGYRFDWFGLMPYLTAEYFVVPNVLELNRPPTNDKMSFASLGVNARPTHNVTLKLEANYAAFAGEIPDDSAFADPVGGFQAQAAWAF